MSQDKPVTEIERPFADGRYLFRLPLPQLAELQTKCGGGLGEIFARLLKGGYLLEDGSVEVDPREAAWRIEDIVETIRLGLIGGGGGIVNDQPVQMSAVRANQLVERYVYPAAPLTEGWSLAVSILSACVVGFDPPKKAQPGEGPATDAAGSTTPQP